MTKKKTWTIRKRSRSTKRSSLSSLYLTPSEVGKLQRKLKLPNFNETYKLENIKVTSKPRLEYRINKAREEGTEPEDLVIESNLNVFEDEACEKLVVSFKQNILNSEKARELGKTCNFLYDKAPFVPWPHGMRVGASGNM